VLLMEGKRIGMPRPGYAQSRPILAEALPKDATAALIICNHFTRVGFAGTQRLQCG